MGPPAVTWDLDQQIRCCATCGVNEGELLGLDQPVALQLCGTCRVARYCSEDCQLVDWPKHRKMCKKKSQTNKTKALAKLNLVRFFFRAQSAPVPMHAIHTILQDWTEIYRPLLTFALVNASLSASSQPTQVFFVKLSMAYKFDSQVKARYALRVEDAELLPLEEFRRATVNKSHRLFSDKNGRLLDGFNKHMQARLLLGSWERLTMVVQRLEVKHEGVMMPYYRSWFYESDGSTHARLKNGVWLAYLKEKVAVGKGWNPEGVRSMHVQ